MADMIYEELRDCLPRGFELLLIASQSLISDCVDNIICLSMPLKVHDLLNTVSMMSQSIESARRRRKVQPKERKPEEVNLINEAKSLLMNRNNMTEDEAYRYIQKSSMDSSTNMVETAQMILSIMRI
jgi:response regulator NasT